MPPITSPPEPKWRLEDLLDLEYFLHQDHKEKEPHLKSRDRRFYLDRLHPDDRGSRRFSILQEDAGFIRQLLYAWVGFRRGTRNTTGEKAAPLPGSLVRGMISLLYTLFALAGTLIGGAVTASFFSYTGDQPLNVSYFLSLTLGLPLLILLMSCFLLVLGLIGIRPASMTVIRSFTVRLMETVIIHTAGWVPVDKRASLTAALGIMRSRKRLYGSAFFWPFWTMGHLFALGFSAGALVLTLVRVFFSDVAFGWQSTLSVGADLVYSVVSAAALPWSWAFPEGVGYPSLDQIAGSRMVLKDGMVHLATPDLVSWWPFLCLCLVCYGILPRLLLLAGGMAGQRRALDRLSFQHLACRQLVQRMVVPEMTTSGRDGSDVVTVANPSAGHTAYPSSDKRRQEIRDSTGPAVRPPRDPVPVDDPPAAVPNSPASLLNPKAEAPYPYNAVTPSPVAEEHFPSAPLFPVVVLVPEDLDPQMTDTPEFKQILAAQGKAPVQRIEMTGESEIDLAAVIPAVKRSSDPGAAVSWNTVLIVQEAWQPPIKETLFFLKQLRRELGRDVEIRVMLMGRPDATTLLTPPSSLDRKVWRQKLDTLADPGLGILVVGDEI